MNCCRIFMCNAELVKKDFFILSPGELEFDDDRFLVNCAIIS